jgi:hypothetical protein
MHPTTHMIQATTTVVTMLEYLTLTTDISTSQPGKGPSFHTDAFNRGYDDGFNACSSRSSDNGGGASDDRDERAGSTEILSNAQDCYDAAYGDGQDFPFDQGANDFCRQFTDDQGNPYYTGFIDGCVSVQGNTLDICESATD